MDLKLTNNVAFIAGSSRGIGLAIAQAFVREGARVIVTGRDKQILEGASTSLVAQGDENRILAIEGDMTDSATLKQALDRAMSSFGRIDAVVANIGRGSEPGGWDVSEDLWQSSLRVNFLGSMALATAAMPYLLEQGHGSLTFVSSIAGLESINAPVAYSAAKAAIISAMKNLARQVGPRGVRVNAVAPGNVLFPGGTWEKKLEDRREFIETYIRSEVPLQRFATPDEIADSVVFLSSPRASFITGACLVVDGGQTRSF